MTPVDEICATPSDDDCQGAKPDCGKHLWSKSFGSAGDDHGDEIVVDATGAVIVTGEATADFGGGLIEGYPFLTKLDAGGHHLWSKAIHTVSVDVGVHLALDPEGNIVLAGGFQGTLDLGGPSPLVSAGSRDVFVAKLDADGALVWAKSFGGPAFEAAYHVSVGPSGDIALTGTFDDTVSFGGAPLTTNGAGDIFVARLGPNGGHLWSRGFGGALTDYPGHIAVGPLGEVVLTGTAVGPLDLGGGVLTPKYADMFLVSFTATGEHSWSTIYPASGSMEAVYASGLAIDASGDVLIEGDVEDGGSIDLGGGPLPVMFVGRLAPSGEHIWSRSFGAEGDGFSALGLDPIGNVLLAGRLTSDADFGGGPLPHGTSPAPFLAKLDPSGAHSWSVAFAAAPNAKMHCIAAGADASVHVTGHVFDGADLGGGPLVADTYGDVVVAKFAN